MAKYRESRQNVLHEIIHNSGTRLDTNKKFILDTALVHFYTWYKFKKIGYSSTWSTNDLNGDRNFHSNDKVSTLALSWWQLDMPRLNLIRYSDWLYGVEYRNKMVDQFVIPKYQKNYAKNGFAFHWTKWKAILIFFCW